MPNKSKTSSSKQPLKPVKTSTSVSQQMPKEKSEIIGLQPTEPCCGLCVHFERDRLPEALGGEQTTGECKRYPQYVWKYHGNWCGEYKRRQD